MKFTSTHVYFWDGIYSNWHSAKIVDFATHLSFANTEQAFMWNKAAFFGDAETGAKIAKQTDPREVKKLGREVKGFDKLKWDAVCLNAMASVNFLKFSQNADYKRELLETEDRILVEASPYDKIWGVGLREDDPLILDEKNWLGQNLLGKALMQVRESLKNS